MILRALLVLVATTAVAAAQTLDDLRQDLRQRLSDVKFAKALGTLAIASEELSLSSASFSFDDAEDTTLTTFTLPFQRTLDVFGAGAPAVHVEGVLGHACARQSSADVYDGTAPGLETSVTSDWSALSGLVGAGPAFALGERATFSPLLIGGLTHLENETDYGGPGAPFTAALADGIAFNWDATAWVAGAAAQLDWRHPFGELRLELLARYDVRWIGILQSDDPAQDFSTRAQIATLRADLTGPAGVNALSGAIDWRAFTAYRGFAEGDLFGNRSLFELGCALELTGARDLPLVDGAALHGSVFAGDGVRGWTVGVGLLF